jgi:hypothetical protein
MPVDGAELLSGRRESRPLARKPKISFGASNGSVSETSSESSSQSSSRLGVLHGTSHWLHVAFDAEITAPPPIDAGLPDVTGFVVLLGAKRGIAEVLEQESDAPVDGRLNPPSVDT